jgi:hypothetical protein
MSEDVETKTESPERKKYRPPKKTRFLFKLIGLVLVALVGWYGYNVYKSGKVFNPMDPKDQQEIAKSLKKDMGKVVDKTKPYAEEGIKKAVEYLKYTYEDLKKKIKGRPPETKEEVAALVEESQREVKAADEAANKAAGSATKTPEPKPPPKPAGAYAQAKAAYREASRYYAKAHPVKASQEEVQNNIRLAAPLFDKCLALCEKARKEGVSEAKIEGLEQAAARRLYTCRKRMELRMH